MNGRSPSWILDCAAVPSSTFQFYKVRGVAHVLPRAHRSGFLGFGLPLLCCWSLLPSQLGILQSPLGSFHVCPSWWLLGLSVHTPCHWYFTASTPEGVASFHFTAPCRPLSSALRTAWSVLLLLLFGSRASGHSSTDNPLAEP